MSVPIHVRPATVDDVPEIQAAEVAATERFRTIEDPRIARSADAAPYWTAGLERASIEQRAWVAVDDRGSIVGFAVAWVVDGEGHLDELAVTPGVRTSWCRTCARRRGRRVDSGTGPAVDHPDDVSRRAVERPVLREARISRGVDVDAGPASVGRRAGDMGARPVTACGHASTTRRPDALTHDRPPVAQRPCSTRSASTGHEGGRDLEDSRYDRDPGRAGVDRLRPTRSRDHVPRSVGILRRGTLRSGARGGVVAIRTANESDLDQFFTVGSVNRSSRLAERARPVT